MEYSNEIIIADLRAHLSDSRFAHSLNVANSAKKLALMYGSNPENCYTAGLLHDMLKEQNREEALKFFADRGIALSPVEKSAPKLWHAMTGAIYAAEKYSMPNDICMAIRYHTTGRTDMTAIEKILFTADFISDDRDYDGVEEMRKRANISLEDAMEEGLRFTVWELSSNGRAIHPDTIAAYNQIILLKGSK